MDTPEILTLLEKAGDDPAKQALVCVDLAFLQASEIERDQLRLALQAAAIPHPDSR